MDTSRRSGTHLPIAVTMGEPAGIGGEIALRAWIKRTPNGPTFFVIDDPARLAAIAKQFALPCRVVPIGSAADAAPAFADGLPVLPLAAPVAGVTLGRPDPHTGKAVVASIDA